MHLSIRSENQKKMKQIKFTYALMPLHISWVSIFIFFFHVCRPIKPFHRLMLVCRCYILSFWLLNACTAIFMAIMKIGKLFCTSVGLTCALRQTALSILFFATTLRLPAARWLTFFWRLFFSLHFNYFFHYDVLHLFFIQEYGCPFLRIPAIQAENPPWPIRMGYKLLLLDILPLSIGLYRFALVAYFVRRFGRHFPALA